MQKTILIKKVGKWLLDENKCSDIKNGRDREKSVQAILNL